MKRPIAYFAGTGRGIPATVLSNKDFAALGFFCCGIRNEDTAGALLLFFHTFDDHTVMQWTEFHVLFPLVN